MKLGSRLVSAIISCAIAGSAAFPVSLFSSGAAYTADGSAPIVYNSTKADESKVSDTIVTTSATATTTTTTAKTSTTSTTTAISSTITTTKAKTSTTTAKSSTTTKTTVKATTTATTTAKATTTEVPYNVFDIYNAHKEYIAQNDLYRRSEGIDVSQWQGSIDWQSVKDAGVEFAIIRAGYGKLLVQEDPTFDINMQEAQSVGIQCGTYWYSYALNVEDAYQEAMTCYEIIKDYDFTYPVFFDIEDPSQSKLSTAEVSAIVETFCQTLQEKGYYVGVYSYANFLTTRIFEEVLSKYDVWVAHFDVETPAFSHEYTMWQYTSSGYVDGIETMVDLDHAYINYPLLISPDSYVPAPGTTVSSETTTTTTTTTSPAYFSMGIDVSEWQGDIDWRNVQDVDFAIIRAGYGDLVEQKDKHFDDNIAGAKAAGINCGVYWYSYADSVEDAILEAEACYSIIKDYQFEFPVFYNIEDPMYANFSKEEISAITDAFCSYLEDKGYYVSIGTYANFLLNNFESYIFEKYDIWVAHFGVSKPAYTGNYGVWKYTNSAVVSGIYGYVNASYCYVDYPTIIKQNHLNGY